MRLRTYLLSIACLSVSTSCDSFDPLIATEDFDKHASSTWVHVESLDSSDSEPALVFGGSAGDLRYFVAAGSSVLTHTRFDAGSPSVNETNVRDDYQVSTESFSSQTATASDLSHYADGGNVGIGMINEEGAGVLILSATDDGDVKKRLLIPGGVVPSAISFGATDASAESDLIAISGDTISLFPNYQTLPDPIGQIRSCSLGDPGIGALILDVDATPEAEILVAKDGAISVTRGSTLVAAADANQACFTATPAITTITAPSGEADFGSSILAGDLDGTGSLDLVVTAPSSNSVYVYLNWTVGTPTEPIKVATPPQAQEFGKSAVIGDFDDDGSNELLVADHLHQVAAHEEAGAIYFFKADDQFASSFRVLHDARATAGQHYGVSLMVAKVGTEDVLVVGAKGEIMTYFQASLGDKDIRK